MQQDSTHKHTCDSWRETETDRQTDRQTDRHTDRDMQRKTQTDRQRQTDLFIIRLDEILRTESAEV